MMHRRTLLAVVRSRRGEGCSVPYLERQLQIPREQVQSLLREAELRGEVVATSRGRWVAVEFSDYFTGTLRMSGRGFGVLRAEDDHGPELIIAPEHLGTALDGDRVLVYREGAQGTKKALAQEFGRVVKVLQRRRRTLVGRVRTQGQGAWVEPHARRLGVRVGVEREQVEAVREGEFVEVAVTSWGEGGTLKGQLLRRLGMPGEAGVDEEVVLADLGIPVDFPLEALREAAELPEAVTEAEVAGRWDCRHHPAVTIDGENARDFDDAVVAFAAPSGAIEVFVHVADVSHYVLPGSALDAAARERGTSVYLPGRAVPMLPEKLSNHLCSLLPDQDRLAFSLRVLVTPEGALEGYRAERSVFRSRRRCTYTEVFSWLEHGSWPADLPADVKASLLLLDEAARRLGRRRQHRGALDFDLPVPEVLLDAEGLTTGVVPAERNRAHRLIEELMLAANECVARLLVWGRQPAIFRVHERPSPGKLAELQVVLEEFGVPLKGNLEDLPPRELQRVLAAVRGRPEERLLQTLVLRSLARATYDPNCKGHYALATDFYLHFTSPIRRYPDLVVHRCLERLLRGKLPGGTERDLVMGELEDIAQHSSYTERRAEEAERAVVRWKQAEYMRSRVGEEFTAHVSGVTAFGLFAQLSEVFVEGFIHVSGLRDDYYRYDELGHRLVGQRHGRVLRLGDPLRVRVRGINDERWEVELELVPPPPPPVEAGRAGRPRGRAGASRKSREGVAPPRSGRRQRRHP